MSKAKFAAAKELIQEKKYQEARAILEGMDHPTAKEWLERLDSVQPKHRERSGVVFLVGLLVILIIVLIGVVVTQLPKTQMNTQTNFVMETPTQNLLPTSTLTFLPTDTSTPSVDMMAIHDSLRVYCMRKTAVDLCEEISDKTLSNGEANVIRCFSLFGTVLDDFGTCVRPQYATAYDEIMKPLLATSILSSYCQSSSYWALGELDEYNAQNCPSAANRVVTRNPNQVVDTCFNTYLSWNITFNSSDEQLNNSVELFVACVHLEVWGKRF